MLGKPIAGACRMNAQPPLPAADAATLFSLIAQDDAPAVARLLEQAPALADARDAQGVTSVLWALYHEHAGLARLLALRRSSLDLAEQVVLGHGDAVHQAMQDNPALLQAHSADGFTLLGLAVFFRQGELARWMIGRGADVNACAANAMRVGPVHAAVARGDAETLLSLLQAGCDPDMPQTQGVRPIHDAALGGKVHMAALLHFFGADLDARNDKGERPAELAAAAGHALLAERLAQWTSRA
jgi:uncharacterized protein